MLFCPVMHTGTNYRLLPPRDLPPSAGVSPIRRVVRDRYPAGSIACTQHAADQMSPLINYNGPETTLLCLLFLIKAYLWICIARPPRALRTFRMYPPDTFTQRCLLISCLFSCKVFCERQVRRSLCSARHTVGIRAKAGRKARAELYVRCSTRPGVIGEAE